MFTELEAMQIANEIKKSNPGESEADILRKGLTNIAKTLDSMPRYYLSFGHYWWIIKKLFPQYLPDCRKWYCSGVYNAVDANRYGFEKSDFLSYSAAVYYSNMHDFSNPTAHRIETDGQEKIYHIHDEDAPL